MRVIAVTVIHTFIVLVPGQLSLFLLKEYLIPVVTYFFQAKTVAECRIVIAAAPVQNDVFMQK